MNKIFFTTLLIILTFNIYSINEKKIILNQARQYEFRQNYSKSIDLYKIAQEKYPQDRQIVQDLIRVLIRADSTETAGKILQSNKNILKKDTFLNLSIQLDLRKGNVEKAKKMAKDYFKNNHNDINSYATLVRVFESANQIDFAIDLIFKARKVKKDEKYLAMSLARDYNLMGDYAKSIDEYFSYLEKHKSYKFYISSLINKIVEKFPEKLLFLHKYDSNKNPSIQSVLAEVYFKQKNFDEAFKHYKFTSLSEIKRFADFLSKNKEYENAEKVNVYIVENYSDRVVKAESNLELAKIYTHQNKIAKAKDILDKILSDKYLYSKKLKFKSHIIKDSYLLMAKIAILEDNDEQYLYNLNLAKLNTYYYLDKAKMDFKTIDYYFAKRNFNKADSLIEGLNKRYSEQSKIMNQLSLYNFVSSFLNNKSDVDSLLTDVVLKESNDEKTNEMIKYYYYLKNVNPKEKKDFFTAYFMKKISKEKDALGLINNLFATTKNEFYYITALEWSKNYQNKFQNIISEFTLKDTIFKEYVEYQKMTKDSLQSMKNFLNKTQNSFITPYVRKLYLDKSEKNN
jgi:tetratricopeptide (TPR) repeat protein